MSGREGVRDGSWPLVPMEGLLLPLADGGLIDQGWSPQCEKGPTSSEDSWGVLKTTAIQPGAFLPEHNKSLPPGLTPRPRLEVREGDLLITCAGPRSRCGVACLVRNTRRRLMISGKMYRFRVADDRVSPQYLEWYLQSPEAQGAIDKIKTGTSDSGLNLTHARFRRMLVRLAPRDQQDRVVEAIELQLTRLDAGVAALKRAQANLKRYRAAVLKAACEGRLVPTEADLARREAWSYEAASAYLERVKAAKLEPAAPSRRRQPHGHTAAEGPRRLLVLPEGWAWATVGDLAEVVEYGTSARCAAAADGTPVLRMGNIEDGALRLSGFKFLPHDHHEFPRLLLREGDLLFNRTNSPDLVGKSAVYQGVPHPCSFASYLIRVHLSGACLPEYLAACLNSSFGRAWIATVVSQQVGQANVSGGKLRTFPVPLPPGAEQKRIVAEIQRRLSLVGDLEHEISTTLHRATRLRQAILAAVFTGAL
jgi:type I restriction enzyme, S subunit